MVLGRGLLIIVFVKQPHTNEETPIVEEVLDASLHLLIY